MLTTETTLRVRYGETDQMGYTYHANYINYFEIGRTEMLRQFGISYGKMEAEGTMLPVVSVSVKYILPTFYDDLLTIRTSLVELPKSRVTFTYEINNQHNQLVATGEATLVFFDRQRNRPTRAPEYFIAAVKSYFDK